MPLPSDYQPTLSNPLPYYAPINPDADALAISFGASAGITYQGPLIQVPTSWRSGSNYYIYGITGFPEIRRMSNYLKGFSAGKRGLRPVLAESGDFWYFYNDRFGWTASNTSYTYRGITYPGGVSNGNMINLSATGSYATAWPVEGVSAMYNYFYDYVNAIGNCGATIDACINDYEGGGVYQWVDYLPTNFFNYLIGTTTFANPYAGMTSWKTEFETRGGTYSGAFGTYGTTNWWAWYNTSMIYTSSVWTRSFANALFARFPDSTFANYDYYTGDSAYFYNPIVADGHKWAYGKYVGNAHSPVLYGRIRQASFESSYGVVILESDPTNINWYLETKYNGIEPRSRGLVQCATTSFLQALTELKSAKRNGYDKAIIPWLNGPNIPGYRGEGHLGTLSYTIDSNQSPPVTLSNTWYKNNIVGVTRGYTAYDGTTNAFQFRSPVLGTTGNVWYKQNISGITYDAGTTSFILNTVGTTGNFAALAYYYSGISNGVTYVFSYDIDVTRGFSGISSRFITWKTSDVSTTVPPLSTTTGITYQQVLPVSGGIAYTDEVISYAPGSSGWTTVAWRFVGSPSSTEVGLYVYYAKNSSSLTGGYTAYVRNPRLVVESTGTNVLINPIDFVYSPSSAYSSLEYYFRGITPGITYAFSYYIDPRRGVTATLQQNIQHYVYPSWNNNESPIYNLPYGITFSQSLPNSVGPFFSTGGVNLSGATTWTKVSWKFNSSIYDINDPVYTSNFKACVLGVQNCYSVMDPRSSMSGHTFYISNPTFEVDGGSAFTVVDWDYETISRWAYGPAIGWCDAVRGPNRRYDAYLVNRGGNSAYFYELTKHACVLGTKHFGLFNPDWFRDFGITGSISGGGGDFDGPKMSLYTNSGSTYHIKLFRDFDATLKEANEKIGGFTLTTADTSRVNWNLPYQANGAPDIKGITWWWRVTAIAGYTVYVNGETLGARGKAGTWVPTSGPTLTGISWSSWPYENEMGITAASKDFNFSTMSSLTDLTNAGFTFSRGSTATYINSSGNVITVGPNQPRFTYDPSTLQPLGLLVEPASRNILNWSESFASTGGAQNNWIDTNITRVTGVTSPAGNTTAIRFISNAKHSSVISSAAAGSSLLRAFSFWFRGVTGNESLSYTLNGGSSWLGITSVGNTWYRFTPEPTTANQTVGFRIGNTGEAVEVWGAQLEPRVNGNGLGRNYVSYMDVPSSSYIPTGSTGAVRSADTCGMTGISFSSSFGITYGTLVVEGIDLGNVLGPQLVQNNGNRLYLDLNVNILNSRIYGINQSVTVSAANPSNFATNQVYTKGIKNKLAFTYSPKGIKIANVGNVTNTVWGSTGARPQFAYMNIAGGFATIYDSATIERIRVWSFALGNPDLEKITTTGYDYKSYFCNGFDD